MNPAFWQGRRVFLTGHTGFKGGWLSLWLQQLGAVVTGYALPPATEPSLFVCARVAEGMHSIFGDVRDLAALTAAMLEAAPEVVIHMAAQPLVRRAYADPVETYSTNVMGTVHLLEAARHCLTVRAVVNVTTDKCYENREWVWPYRENDPLGGYDPYSSSKGCAELVTAAYRNAFFNPAQYAAHGVAIASARAGNVIGGGDWSTDRLIPDILAAFSEGRPVTIRQPLAVRPWQHVLEPLRGYLVLAERLHQDGAVFGEPFNFGPRSEDARPVEWIVRELAQHWGAGASWTLDPGEHPHEAMILKLDIAKAAACLGWTPWLALGQALSLTVDWARGIRSGQDARVLSHAQIAAYQAGRPRPA
ncbi:CDP-glucose 4,6-dehydratase [Chitinolyticbacter meiyuanensis]|uniref:CDP-glucose 4,6-dehydratase n=1 Tax=Chitinolyticbacter meiyuanensis TaxID=682798 RepID=UPI0011E5EEC1|nr:CDP-glucose 4,6-dehydratase [Chitinolyticbacter meiyuanensis]